MIPSLILLTWLSGLGSLVVLGGGVYLAWAWFQRAWVYSLPLERYVFAPVLGFNSQTALLIAALGLLLWALLGGLVVRWILGLAADAANADEPPRQTRGGIVHRLPQPDGSELQVEIYGPADGPPIILTHGWGLNSTEFYYLKQQLSDHFRVIVWDLAGLGLSTQPANRDHSLENMARGLETVLRLADDRPALLLGHSIGGMIILTFCRLFPEALGTRVAGLALVHTTYTNPVRTAKYARLLTALERPLIVPMLHLTIWLWPLVWLMNVLGYLNGILHLITKPAAFAGNETLAQLDFTARFQPQASPAVLARGMFGMLAYDATATLPTIPIPTLVIAADQDPLCLPAASEYIHQTVPAAQLVALAPARHMGLLEHHRHFAELVRTFASSCLSADGLSRAVPYRGTTLPPEPPEAL